MRAIIQDIPDISNPRLVTLTFNGIKGLSIVCHYKIGANDNPQLITANGKVVDTDARFENFDDFGKWLGKNIDNICIETLENKRL